MTDEIHSHSAGFDAEELKLPRLVRSQLRRRRPASRDSQRSVVDIEERVREALYGRSYYDGPHRRVHKELEGKHAA